MRDSSQQHIAPDLNTDTGADRYVDKALVTAAALAYASDSQSVRVNERKFMFKRTSFQTGSLKKEQRKLGPDVWTYRWREIGPDGRGRKPKVIVGTVVDFPTLSLAKRAVEALGLGINSSTPQAVEEITMEQLMAHYTAKELSEERDSKTSYTCDVYRGYFKVWVLPRWGTYRLGAVKTSEVESWLRSIDRANGTKVKIRNLMATLFNHAIRWEFAKSNPITGPSRGSGVRQSGKRAATPEVLTIEEIRLILNELSDRHRTLVFLFACTGLRFSELRGLKWMDFNLASLSLEIRRGVVKRYLGDLKTRASQRVMPLHKDLAALLEKLRDVSPHNRPTDWVFASTIKNGAMPIWPTSLMVDHIQPAAVRAGVKTHVTWKMFRTSIATQLNANGENIKTAQQTLGHANSQITANVYTQAVPSAVRSAHDRIVDMVIAVKTPAKAALLLSGPRWPQIPDGVAVSC